jgi:dynamin 1-like protein
MNPNNSKNTPPISQARDPSFRESWVVRLAPVPEVIKISNEPTDREKLETETIKVFVKSYYDIVKKNIIDLVPKTIMHFLVNQFRDGIANHLNAELYPEIGRGELLREKDDVMEERAKYRAIRGMLTKAADIVNEVRDFHMSSS